MKIKMVKMGMDMDEKRNHRIRGIIPTKDGKYLFVEIMECNRPEIQYTSLSSREYKMKYPNKECINIDSIFRVDNPKDYYNYYSPEFHKFEKIYYELSYTNDNIVQLLKEFNKDIESIDLVDENYIEEFCKKNGFYQLYDSRLKHDYKPIEILKSRFRNVGPTIVKFQYTCYSSSGIKYSEERKEMLNFYDLIQNYGIDTIQPLVDKYINKLNNKELQEECKVNSNKVFEEIKKELNEDLENEYINI